jgi:hypothetical protein
MCRFQIVSLCDLGVEFLQSMLYYQR